MQRNPRAHVLLVGSDDVAYGAKRGDGMSWREWALKEWPMDPDRLHVLPALSYEKYLAVIQRSWVHVYWTVPLHSELEPHGVARQRLLRRGQCHPAG